METIETNTKLGIYSIDYIFKKIEGLSQGTKFTLEFENDIVNPRVSRTLKRIRDDTYTCCKCHQSGKYFHYTPSCSIKLMLSSNNWISLDHIIPKSKGGTWHFDNTVIMCQNCNSIKSDTIDEKHKEYNKFFVLHKFFHYLMSSEHNIQRRNKIKEIRKTEMYERKRYQHYDFKSFLASEPEFNRLCEIIRKKAKRDFNKKLLIEKNIMVTI